MAEKESEIIKELIERLVVEKQQFQLFIIEQKLTGEFIRWSAERDSKLSEINKGYQGDKH